tara:strand:+ start:6511 stop:6759 length:249 start_codon:yes stop_codon:yes gene_type:complete
MNLLILLNKVIFLYINIRMDFTRVTIEQGKKTVSVEISETDIDYMAFMDLIRVAIKASKYQKEEINDYVLDWADHIKAAHEN